MNSTHAVAIFSGSFRKSRWARVTAAVLEPHELAATRALLRSLRRPEDRRLHFKAMTNPRRRSTAAQLAAARLRCWIYTGRGDPEVARQACLRQLVADLLKQRCQRLVLESRGASDDHRDARTLASMLALAPSISGLIYEHPRSYEDPLLWIPDAVSWCYGAGGDWRRRVSPIVDRVIDSNAVEERS